MMIFRNLLWLALIGLAVPGTAQTPLAQAIAADPARAMALAEAQGDLTRDLVIWHQQRRGEGSVARASDLLARRPDWPGAARLRREAERMISDHTSSADVLALLADAAPQTGRGALALARALRGDPARAEAVIIAAWRDLPLTEDEETVFLAVYPVVLAPHHGARADALLDAGDMDGAARMIPRLTDSDRSLIAARMAYVSGSGVAAAYDAVPEAARTDPALLAARFAWLARQGRRDEAAQLVSRQSAKPGGLGDAGDWAGWRRRLVRDAMAKGDDMLAYDLAAHHHLTEGAAFADLEWLAGYIALRRLDAPAVAEHHFTRLGTGVTTPISRARAAYWQGRARAASDQEDAARSAFQNAAQWPFTFYGRLALEELQARGITTPSPAPAARSDESLSDMSRALLLLIDAGERGSAYLFSEALCQTASAPQIRALIPELERRGAYFYALRIGKGAAARGIVEPRALFPLHPLGGGDLPVDPALALAVARQESEFRVDAGSSAGALGIMQILPGTAREMARQTGLPYEQARLTRDWGYNSALGSAYLSHLHDRFGESPALIAAAYNAGPGRANDWIRSQGDPRGSDVDPIDWIETIPFSETRNYVMRVTEAIPVYQEQRGQPPARLHDLLRGAEPVPRPRARPDRNMQPVSPDAGTIPPAPETAPAILRPRARPPRN